VIYVGNDVPWYCSNLGTVVTDQLFVAIEHVVGEQSFATVYKRLQSVAVAVGDLITDADAIEGKLIGVSGDSGCTTTEHLHFSVRVSRPNDGAFYWRYGVRTDPYGASPSPPGDPEGMVFNQKLWVDTATDPQPPVVSVP